MNINKNNYEAFFLDYHEGNLSPQEVAELLLFLEQHPELKEDFESFENITLYDLNPISFEDKSGLKREINEENREDWFIRSVEGKLDEKEEKLLSEFLINYPRYSVELELFKKTILPIDTGIIFENKQSLKKTAIITGTDELLISAVEGILSREEHAMLMQQLSVDAEMQHELNLYKQTILASDPAVVYENKDDLKRKERKAVPIFWYVSGIAAAILILFGLFFLFNTGKKQPESQMANGIRVEKNPGTAIQGSENKKQAIPRNEVAVNNKNSQDLRFPAVSKKKQRSASVSNQVANNQQPSTNNEVADNHQPKTNNRIDEQAPVVAENKQPLTNSDPPALNNQQPAIAFNDPGASRNDAGGYLTLREFAAEKIKEKTLDENSVAQQKQNGRLKRFNGWDVVQIVSRGVSKVIGRDLEVKPKYNDDGVVTAYALGNAFEVSRGK
ncbi:MAG: hypothetical protein ACJ77K_11995 [Bacteroidia bacterium]